MNRFALLGCVALACLGWASHADADVTISKGPYFLEVGQTEARVMVESESPTSLTIRLSDDSNDALTETIETRRWRRDGRAIGDAMFRGLTPDTTYQVEVVSGSLTESGSFRTAPTVESDLSFLVYGDNRTQHEVHRSVVEVMEREENVRFLLHTGDMVEMGGRPRDWDAYFDIARDFLRHHPLFPSLGNHELYGPGGANNYARHFRPPLRNAAYYSLNYGPVRVIALDSNEEWDAASPQLAWLRETLAQETDARFTFVVLHHAPLSSGPHGGHEGMQENGVVELMRDAGVDLVFSGHDHMYERGDRDGYKYIVSGGGGAPLYYPNNRIEGQFAFVPAYHYLRVDLVGDEVQIAVIQPDGSHIEDCAFHQGEAWRCDGGGPNGPISTEEAPMNPRDMLWWAAGAGAVLAFSLGFWWWRRRRRRSK